MGVNHTFDARLVTAFNRVLEQAEEAGARRLGRLRRSNVAQGGTSSFWAGLLGEALQLLGELQHAYRTFQSESVQIAREHPGLVREELHALRERLLKFHALRPYDAYLAKLAQLAPLQKVASTSR